MSGRVLSFVVCQVRNLDCGEVAYLFVAADSIDGIQDDLTVVSQTLNRRMGIPTRVVIDCNNADIVSKLRN